MTTWTPGTLDSFDTSPIIWQKLNQLGWLAAAAGTLNPPLVDGQQYLKSEDGTWHLVDLQTESGINTERVLQDSIASPGPQYRGYVVFVASDATKHRVDLAFENGTHTLFPHQDTTSEAGVSELTLSAPGGDYDVTMVLEGGIYALRIEQP